MIEVGSGRNREQRALRRQRAAVAGGSFLLALLLLAPLAYLAFRRDAERAEANTLEWAESRLDQALASFRSEDIEAPANTWLVNPVDGWSNPLGETWTEPPLLTLAGPVIGDGGDPTVTGSLYRAYDFDGPWLAAGRWHNANEVVLTVVERGDQDGAIRLAKARWTAIAIALAAVAGAAAWFVARRAQAPIDRAHAVNRDFIADAAHELRTPLAVIQASAGHALARDRAIEEYRTALAEILQASERAGSSVGELLEFARLEAGQGSPRMAPLRLDLLVEEVAASVKVDATLVEASPSEAVVVDADYNLVRQVIDNIARNAAARAQKVTLSTHLEQRGARIDVVDDGPGFDAGIIDHVFERFRRGDQSGSVGLGMAIARTIVELHGGTCDAANQPGGGALVTVRLPYRQS